MLHAGKNKTGSFGWKKKKLHWKHTVYGTLTVRVQKDGNEKYLIIYVTVCATWYFIKILNCCCCFRLDYDPNNKVPFYMSLSVAFVAIVPRKRIAMWGHLARKI